jgi:pimeloyl-ACP methyl ester carboxylesterase
MNSGANIMRIIRYIFLLIIAAIVAPPAWFLIFPEDPAALPTAGVGVNVAPGISVNALDEGSGRPIVLVHGLPGSAYDWRELTPLLNDAGFRTIAYDRVGYGRSDARPSGPYSLSANVDELLALLEELDLNDVTLVGWSYGGAMTMAAANTDRIRRIVLVGTGGPDSDDAQPRERPLAMKVLFSKPVVMWRSAVPPVSRFLQAASSEPAFSGGAQPDWWLPQLAANFERTVTVETYRREISADFEIGVFDPAAIVKPTLILHGDDDRLAPIGIGRYLAEKIPGAEYSEIAGASHMLPITHAELLAQEIAEFAKPTQSPDSSERLVNPGARGDSVLGGAHQGSIYNSLDYLQLGQIISSAGLSHTNGLTPDGKGMIDIASGPFVGLTGCNDDGNCTDVLITLIINDIAPTPTQVNNWNQTRKIPEASVNEDGTLLFEVYMTTKGVTDAAVIDMVDWFWKAISNDKEFWKQE